MKIQLNNKSKINNPVEFVPNNDPSYVYSFEGEFDEELFTNSNLEYQSHFKHQSNNLNNLKNLLENLNLQLEYIWLIIFRNDSNRMCTSFVIKTNTNDEGLTLFWRKYISKAEGSGQNDIFLIRNEELVKKGCVDKIKVQLTNFLKNSTNLLNSL